MQNVTGTQSVINGIFLHCIKLTFSCNRVRDGQGACMGERVYPEILAHTTCDAPAEQVSLTHRTCVTHTVLCAPRQAGAGVLALAWVALNMTAVAAVAPEAAASSFDPGLPAPV